MGRVKCSLCGTKFDIVAHGGSCPNCGCHYHKDGEAVRVFEGSHEHSEMHQHYDGAGDVHEYTHTSVQQTSSGKYDGTGLNHDRKNKYDVNKVRKEYHESQNASKSSISGVYRRPSGADTKAQKKWSRRISCLVVLIFILIVVSSIYSELMEEKEQAELEASTSMYEPADVESYAVDVLDSIYVEDFKLDLTDSFYIRDGKTVKLYDSLGDGSNISELPMNWNLADGYEILGFRYNIFTEGASTYEFGDMAKAYVVTTEGVYLEPLDPYELDEYISEEEADELTRMLGYGLTKADGVLLYIVKEGTFDSLLIDVEPEGGNRQDAQVEVKYLVTGTEVRYE